MSELMNKKLITKPILKWVGGKTQIIDKILPKFPREINNYHEIFLGGGSVLFALLSYINNGIIKCNGKIYAYDVNTPLINLYINIQKNPIELFNSISEMKEIYSNITSLIVNRKPESIAEALSSKESYYYWIRIKYNELSGEEKKTIHGTTMFIFLNKTCFRGIFREGPNGFNVPYGNNKNPEIANLNHIVEVSNLIQNVIFEACCFEKAFENISVGDFTYLDPPYAPKNQTSFVSYTKKGFDEKQHNELFDLCRNLKHHEVKMMMSNLNVPMVIDKFPTELFVIDTILCKRLINSKKPSDTEVEVIITNY
jgi:DNA adenine methylase